MLLRLTIFLVLFALIVSSTAPPLVKEDKKKDFDIQVKVRQTHKILEPSKIAEPAPKSVDFGLTGQPI